MPKANKNSNESKICEFVIRKFEDRFNGLRQNVSHPEIDRIGSPIDVRLIVNAQYIAIEHTLVESFSGQIAASKAFLDFIKPLDSRLVNQLSKPGMYSLTFPWDICSILKTNPIRNFELELIEWTVDQSKKFCLEHPVREPRIIKPFGIFQIENFGFDGGKIAFSRDLHWARSDKFDGRIRFNRIAPEPLEDYRNKRILAALERKCPKLEERKLSGDYSVLILEDQDMALSNDGLITEAIQNSNFDTNSLPDEIIYADTTIASTWYFSSIYRKGVFLPDVDTDDFFFEVDPTTLQNSN